MASARCGASGGVSGGGAQAPAGATVATPPATTQVTPQDLLVQFGADKVFAVVFLLLYNQNKASPGGVLRIAHTYLATVPPCPSDRSQYLLGVLAKLTPHLTKVQETCAKFDNDMVPVSG